jgi:hypothetical protein
MLRLIAAAFALTMVPVAAHAMECCEDGKCACCKKEGGTDAPAPEGHDQH